MPSPLLHLLKKKKNGKKRTSFIGDKVAGSGNVPYLLGIEVVLCYDVLVSKLWVELADIFLFDSVGLL